MARYIDADELNDEYYELFHHGTMAVKMALPVFVDLLDKQPTADVVEVEHGHWENGMFCSVCGYLYDTGEYTNAKDYCPNCGAKMDGTPKERGGEK